MLPRAVIDLKNFFVLDVPPENSMRDLDLDFQVRNCSASVYTEQSEGDISSIDVFLPSVTVVKRATGALEEAILVQIQQMIYQGSASMCSPLNLTAKVLGFSYGTDGE